MAPPCSPDGSTRTVASCSSNYRSKSAKPCLSSDAWMPLSEPSGDE